MDRTCDVDDPVAAPSQLPDTSEPGVDAYIYQRQRYEIVIVDENQSAAKLNQYWLYTGAFDCSSTAYRDQVKMIIADIAHAEGTNKFFAEVVTDKEIAFAESPSMFRSFIEEHGSDYAVNTIPQHEMTGWVASCSGRFDSYAGEAGDSTDAFEVVGFP